MKKIALSLASVLAATAFAPEASAIPAFARQTGMACSACHAQHFPVLNGFGRAFKSAGFTMMGSQEKIEGDHLSLPATLNFGQLLKVRYQKTSGPAGTPSGVDTNGGQWQFPDEYALFVGGRLFDNGTVKGGVMAENALGGTNVGIVAGLRVPVVVELDAAKLSVIPFTTDSLGPFYGYTESSQGINRAIRWAEHRMETSSFQYVTNTKVTQSGGEATGLAMLVHTDMGYINVTRFAPTFAEAVQMSSTAVEIAATPTIADMATIFSVNILSGDSYLTGGATKISTKATAFSAQAHGELAGMEAGLYAQYAKGDSAAASDFGDRKSVTVGADFTVIPHTLSVGAAVRSATNSVNEKDNATTFTAVYDLAQNVALVGNYTKYGKVQYKNEDPTNLNLGDSLVTFMLEAAW
ncbi:MAG: porin [Gammaproteobacteria bacterium]|nr:porin [Sideroxydans sp.]MBU3904346.1 porin [Gammaproteobacteria bacterium]MBU4045824.1 porin [Gammaproteobacteria bacterium]